MEYTIDTNNSDFVKTRNYTTPHATYTILNRNVNDSENLEYRSVVLDPESKKVLCFAPPKSVSNDKFDGLADVEATEIIEGTMMNLFYDGRIQSWELATKGAIGGNYWYFRTQYKTTPGALQLTFRDMFIDALREAPGTKLNDIALIQTLDKSCVYSFVMQHPANHIVIPIKFPTIYIVAIYRIVSDNVVRYVPLDDVFANSPVLRPIMCYTFDCDAMKLRDYHTMGFMLYHPASGMRTSILNPQYIRMKEFRGNNPNLQYHYLCLSRAGKVKEYLDIFAGYKNLFYGFHMQSAEFIKTLHNAYVTYFVNKRGKEVQIDKHIFRHICKLHNQVYLPSINSGNKMIVNCKLVADYFNAMEPKEQLYHLNYQNREYKIESERTELTEANC